MAFKKARGVDLYNPDSVMNESTEEILDYLINSKSAFKNHNFGLLKKRMSFSFSKKVLGLFEDLLRISGVSNKSVLVTIFLTLMAVASSPANAAINLSEIRLVQQVSNDNNLTSVSEESIDDLSGVKPGNPVIIIPQNSKIHIVKPGEDLVQISNRYKVPIQDLIKANFRVDILNLKGREKIVIPEVKTRYVRSHRYNLASRGFSPSLGFSTGRSFIWPVDGTMKVSSRFGYRWNRFHEGIDIPGPIGTGIFSAKTGVVEFAGWKSGYGKCVIINHGDGFKTLYAHASRILVRVGDVIESGQIIAQVGNTGRATGPHLHFEVIVNGTPRNPENFL